MSLMKELKKAQSKILRFFDRRRERRFSKLQRLLSLPATPFSILQERVSALESSRGSNGNHMSLLLSTVSALQDQTYRCAQIETRVHALEERLLDLSLNLCSSGNGRTLIIPRFMTDQLNAPVSEIRVNLNAAAGIISGMVNVGQTEAPGVDLIADPGRLPYCEASLNEVRCAFLLDHYPPADVAPLLAYWRTLLRPGGKVTIIGRDLNYLLHESAAGVRGAADLKELLFGNAGPLYRIWNAEEIEVLLSQTNFFQIQRVTRGAAGDTKMLFEVLAVS